MPLQMKANCDLHSSAKGIKKNAVAMSIVAYHLAALDSSSYCSSNMSGTATLIGTVTYSGRNSLLVTSILHQTFALATWGY